MTAMTSWNDDDTLVRDLREAVLSERAVSDRSRAAAHAAFSWRTVDQELDELLSLAHDSSVAGAALVRSATDTDPRLLSFEGGALALELEVMGDDLVGLVVPGRACRVTVRSAEGRSAAVEVDDSGFFSLTGVPTGTVRFEVVFGSTQLATGWLLI
jgi:hypothetical protein